MSLSPYPNVSICFHWWNIYNDPTLLIVIRNIVYLFSAKIFAKQLTKLDNQVPFLKGTHCLKKKKEKRYSTDSSSTWLPLLVVPQSSLVWGRWSQVTFCCPLAKLMPSQQQRFYILVSFMLSFPIQTHTHTRYLTAAFPLIWMPAMLQAIHVTGCSGASLWAAGRAVRCIAQLFDGSRWASLVWGICYLIKTPANSRLRIRYGARMNCCP